MHRFRISYPSSRYAMTLVEMVIAFSLLSLVFLAVAALQIMTARNSDAMYDDARGRTDRLAALERIAYELMMADTGSVSISNNDQRLEFNNPNLGSGVTSRFDFANNALTFDEDIDDGQAAEVIKDNLDSVTFAEVIPWTVYSFTIGNSTMQFRANTINESIQTEVYLRN